MKKTHSSLTAYIYLSGHLLGTYYRRSAEKPSLVGLSNYWIQSYHSQLPIVGLVGLKTVSHCNKFLNI